VCSSDLDIFEKLDERGEELIIYSVSVAHHQILIMNVLINYKND
jgi:hypothetical protein